MKILFFSSALTGGGAERVLSILANAMADNGKDVVIATDLSYPIAYKFDDRVKLTSYRKEPKFLGRFQIVRFISMLKEMRCIARMNKPDIMVSFQTSMNIFTFFSLFGLKAPLILCEHTNVRRNISLRKLSLMCYPFAKAVTVLTRSDYQYWHKRPGKKNVVYMPNPYIGKELQIKQEQRDKVVIAVGRVNSWEVKGFDNLIRSWSSVCHSYLDWSLVIAGNYDEKSLAFLNDLIQETNSINVKFLGFRNDIDNILRRSKVFVLSSRTEGLPMGLLEAMAAGCCCVSFDVVTGPNEIITNGVDGILVENQSIKALTEALEKVMSDEVLLNQLASKAPTALKRYSLDRILRRWDILFSKVTTTN